MALLLLASAWAKAAGRRLLAIIIDHGLNRDSRDWSRVCAEAAQAVGADWIERRWEGEKPKTGLPAAARRARHALIADAAREAGAKVVLFAHTADDIAESDWMRERGSTLGSLREWSPSPAWPAGRGLMLLRPVLEERRAALRGVLREAGQAWVEDPGNTRFARGRARAALSPLPSGEGLSARERQRSDLREGVRAPASIGEGEPLSLSAETPRCARRASSPLPLGEGFKVERTIGPQQLSAAILCASGHDAPPRRDRLDTLADRFASGEDFTATLAGARIEAICDRVLIGREPGDLRRRPTPDIALPSKTAAVWDGRYEIIVENPGWIVTAAQGRLNALSKVDRAIAATAPAWARAALPILIRDGSDAPVLAWREAQVRNLAPRRLSLAMGETTHESDLHRTIHGETTPPDLF